MEEGPPSFGKRLLYLAGARNELESLWAPNRWLLPDSAAGEGPKFNPDERLKEITGVRLIAATDEKPKSAYIKSLDAKLRSEDTPCKVRRTFDCLGGPLMASRDL